MRGAWVWRCPGGGCSDGQETGKRASGKTWDLVTLEQGPGSPGDSRQPCPWVSNLLPTACGGRLCAVPFSPWSRDCPNQAGTQPPNQANPSTGLGWGCLVPRDQAGREGTGTLPELLLYK